MQNLYFKKSHKYLMTNTCRAGIALTKQSTFLFGGKGLTKSLNGHMITQSLTIQPILPVRLRPLASLGFVVNRDCIIVMFSNVLQVSD